MHDHKRRRLLGGMARGLVAGPALTGATFWSAGPAHAQSDYRALVCVYLAGGNDGLNMTPPSEAAAHGRYAAVRQQIAIARNALIDLDGSNGLHPAMDSLKMAWDQGRMALVHNVGPLARPLTLAQYQAWRNDADATKMPQKLFSHSDQRLLWENAGSESIALRGGWGGRLMEALSAGQVLSFGGNSRFGTGVLQADLALPGPGASMQVEGCSLTPTRPVGRPWPNCWPAPAPATTWSVTTVPSRPPPCHGARPWGRCWPRDRPTAATRTCRASSVA